MTEVPAAPVVTPTPSAPPVVIVPGLPRPMPNRKPPRAVAAEKIGADLAHEGAVDLGDPDLEHDLLRRRRAQAADHLGVSPTKAWTSRSASAASVGLGDGAGEEHHAVHRRGA